MISFVDKVTVAMLALRRARDTDEEELALRQMVETAYSTAHAANPTGTREALMATAMTSITSRIEHVNNIPL